MLTSVSVANVRDTVSLLSVRENGRYKSLLLQTTHWKLVEITLKIELIVPDFQKYKVNQERAIVWGCEIFEHVAIGSAVRDLSMRDKENRRSWNGRHDEIDENSTKEVKSHSH